jgi:hypothetical protein
MAHVKLGAGAEFDILSGQEYVQHSQKLHDATIKVLGKDAEGQTFTKRTSFTTNASGIGQVNVHVIPQGFLARLHRLAFDFVGSSTTSPLTADVRIYRDVITPSGIVDLWNLLPATFYAGFTDAPLFMEGQTIIGAILSGGPVSTQVDVVAQYTLKETKGGGIAGRNA